MVLAPAGAPRFVVVACGAVSSLAEGALPTAMLLRTGTSGLSPTVRRDRDGAALIMGHVPTIDAGIEGDERAARLADRALEECIADLGEGLRASRARTGSAASSGPLRAGLAVSFGPPSTGDALARGVASPVELVLAARVAKGRERAPLDPVERASAGERERDPIELLGESLAWLGSGRADLAFWGATHTDWSTARLLEIEARGMLYDLTKLDAVMPGEGAAFLAWMTAEGAERAGLSPIVELGGHATATVKLDDPVERLGGLAKAAHDATRASASPGIGWVLSDLTFEAQDQLEWEAMVVRAGTRIVRPYVIDNPSRRIGALGCAAIPLYASAICASYRAAHVPSPSALVLGRGPDLRRTGASDASATTRGRRSALWIRRAG
jgi:hypothetical protein